MVQAADNLITRRIFDAQTLVTAFPPRFYDPNKQLVYEIACPTGTVHQGQIVFSRWRKISWPETLDPAQSQTVYEPRPDYFSYEPLPSSNSAVEWYLNFAHYDLFCAYDGPLFAQDEMQVSEHPALGSLREALLASDIKPLAVENGEPTPALIMGVERRCAIATNPNPERDRPYGLYGNNFALASAAAIEQATQVLNPPTITNILAMEAPAGGYGTYKLKEIEYILSTAFTGFTAAHVESQLNVDPAREVVIHTGFWGCGVYGGNRILMALLQTLAARLAQIDRLVFHTANASGTEDFTKAVEIMPQLVPAGNPVKISNLIQAIEAMRFEWGISDGN
ncbi:hypothetical protein [Trichocoleus sp. FACHB-262]|uniref:hypothetical protein n=1 Tax=Trichocoleus sp. FACHB-262 TaxID=2692869 RepID=UPI00168800D2|nr:hypothetical protein [Trichocoleus sp. FACHB-262]MBD2120655.1 hypothetical protein [Trichocoleus sp. FACHB-262]